MAIDNDDFELALDDAEQLLNGEIILYNGPINEDGYGQFVRATKDVPADRKIVLVLITFGGSADSAYRIARYAQSFLLILSSLYPVCVRVLER